MDNASKIGKKIESDVFDMPTLKILSKMLSKSILKSIDWPISTGKEANVFRATLPNDKKHAAVKIYKNETTHFIKKRIYFEGDPRFERSKYTLKNSTILFARKEFKNLRIALRANVHSPIPIYLDKHIVVMSFVGKNGIPYPQLKDEKENITKKSIQRLFKDIKRLYMHNLVHSDLSEYNTLFDIKNEWIYIIDYSQGVVKGHPKYIQFLKRDLTNIANFMYKSGWEIDLNDLYNYITSNSGMPKILNK